MNQFDNVHIAPNRRRVNIQLPSRSEIVRFVGWSTGRLLLVTVPISCDVGMFVSRTFYTTFELLKKTWCSHILKTYDSLPYAYADDGIKEVEAQLIRTESIQPITNLIEAIQGKQLMVIGEMGTGKSTIAQYLAYSIGGRIRVIECEGTPDDWKGLEVIGKGENWQQIDDFLTSELLDLSQQMRIRNQLGDVALNGTETTTIVEEYPELVNKCLHASEWLDRHARRGRKARRFKILLSQYDKVAAWGLEGKSDLIEAFYKIRLGKKAIAHAKSLKNEALIQWLRQDRSHALLDDEALKLPSYQEMRAVLPRFLPSSPATILSPAVVSGGITPDAIAGVAPVVEARSEQPVSEAAEPPQPLQTPQLQATAASSELVSGRALKALLDAGYSPSRVVKEVMGYTGDRYSEGKQKFTQLTGVEF